MDNHRISLNHGAGGTIMREFIRTTFVKAFDNAELNRLTDAARLTLPGTEIAFTTDAYVVQPLIFPGGDLGKLAVCGTVNDLAVMGAKPLYISIACIIEEGLRLDVLSPLVNSAAATAKAAGVQIVTGDTKVVRAGECDGLFITTTGIGALPLGKGLCTEPVSPGDAIILSGTVGEHGVAILAARHELQFDAAVASDCAAIHGLVESVLTVSGGVKWMRDPTRGGVAAVIAELAEAQSYGAFIRESAIPVRPEVAAVCELLGFDPLHLANEGKVVLVVRKNDAEDVCRVLRNHPLGREAQIIGEITTDGAGYVRAETHSGGVRRLRQPAGELLPRIC
jgi:hydrogenase expression/formation protein HypE